MQFTLEEKYFSRLFKLQLFFFVVLVRILFTPYFFFLIEYTCSIVPFHFVFIFSLMSTNTLHETFIINIKTLTNPVTSFAILFLLSINGIHHHFSILRRWTSYHFYAKFLDIIQSLFCQLFEGLSYTEERVLLNNSYKSVEVVELNQAIVIF